MPDETGRASRMKTFLFSFVCAWVLTALAGAQEPPGERAMWEERVRQVHVGMRRAEVERLLSACASVEPELTPPQYRFIGGIGSGSFRITTYYVSPGWQVGVSYDYTGAPDGATGELVAVGNTLAPDTTSPENLVLAPVSLEYRPLPSAPATPAERAAILDFSSYRQAGADINTRFRNAGIASAIKQQTATAWHLSHGDLLFIQEFEGRYNVIREYSVGDDGKEEDVRRSEMGPSVDFQGSQHRHLADLDLFDLRAAISDLPAASVLPPIERLVLVSFPAGDRWVTHSYDADDLPWAVQRIKGIILQLRPEEGIGFFGYEPPFRLHWQTPHPPVPTFPFSEFHFPPSDFHVLSSEFRLLPFAFCLSTAEYLP